MANYPTHSLHGEIVTGEIDKKVDLKDEDIRTFCLGFDTLIVPDNDLFKLLHRKDTKTYFESLIKLIIDNKLQDNSEAMAFLYGQLDHFILDIYLHPLIYYMTKGLDKEYTMDYHALFEHWMDDYVIEKYRDGELVPYDKLKIDDVRFRIAIDELYKRLYNKDNIATKYDIGITLTYLYDYLIRRNHLLVAPQICSILNLGDVFYGDSERAIPFLNLNHDVWYNPETEEKLTTSFDDLWLKSIEQAEEALTDVNRAIYGGKPITTSFITDNLSANTGLNCDVPQEFKKIKIYKR